MNRIDFSFFDGSDGDHKLPINMGGYASEISKWLAKEKELAFITVVEELEGRVPNTEDVKKFGCIHRLEDRPDEELFVWRDKAAAHMKWNIQARKFKFTRLYDV